MEVLKEAESSLETLTASQLLKKLPTFYGTWTFITTFTRAHHIHPNRIPEPNFFQIHLNIIPLLMQWSSRFFEENFLLTFVKVYNYQSFQPVRVLLKFSLVPHSSKTLGETRRIPAPMIPWPPRTSYDLTWGWSQAATVERQKVNAWAMALL
jgi:hypothetical protein